MQLDETLSYIKQAIIDANRTIQHQYQLQIRDFFIYDKKTDSYRPKTINIQTMDSNDSIKQVPLITMITPKTLVTSSMNLSFNTDVTFDQNSLNAKQDKQSQDDGNLNIFKKTWRKLFPERHQVNISVTFDNHELSEGVMRVLDKYLKSVDL